MSVNREQFLDVFLREVPFEGWTQLAMQKSCDHLGIDSNYHAILFERGPAEIAEFWVDIINAQITVAAQGLDELGIRDKIRTLILKRLTLVTPHKPAVQALVHFLMLPQNMGLATRLTWRSADNMWHSIGDRSADFNYYTKRLTLSHIYRAVLLKWLHDESDDMAETKAYLDRQIAGVMRFEKLKANAKATFFDARYAAQRHYRDFKKLIFGF